ncbi:uncharacterized protein [Setaria viridis]|uniref:uncharacterized protein isoform X1 n=1 Tax=Setaria viridis TaxID=4556 RepID=UPI001493BB85|nr:transmembrane protein 205-like isoform X1 [Setaria viridis]
MGISSFLISDGNLLLPDATPIVSGGATLPAFSDAMRQSVNPAMPQGATQIIVVSGEMNYSLVSSFQFQASSHAVSSMLRYLPRHQFGSLQGKMFPAYFMLISACSAISVAAFAYLHPWKTASTVERYQLGFLLLALGCNLSNLLVITPMMVEMTKKRYKLEKDLGIGSEVGNSKNKEMAKRSPALAAMNQKFRMIHVVSSLASLMSFGSLAMHSWYLSSKLDL